MLMVHQTPPPNSILYEWHTDPTTRLVMVPYFVGDPSTLPTIQTDDTSVNRNSEKKFANIRHVDKRTIKKGQQEYDNVELKPIKSKLMGTTYPWNLLLLYIYFGIYIYFFSSSQNFNFHRVIWKSEVGSVSLHEL